MPKNIEDIIVPEKRRSIRDIPIPEDRRNNDKQEIPHNPRRSNHSSSPISEEYVSSIRRRRLFGFHGLGVWSAVGLVLLIIIFSVLSIFNGATVSYVPRSVEISFKGDVYTAQKTGEGGLLFSIVKLSKETSLDAPSSGQEEVSKKASGTIVVYNNASSEPQRLIENTRFETPKGLIYRITEGIVIPGKKVVSGVNQPGSLEVTVYADKAGDEYNIGLTDFTLPGLAGSPRFSTVYARSKTEMSGGFIGVQSKISDEDKAQAKANLQMALKELLISEVKTQVPRGFVLLPSLSTFSFKELPQGTSAKSSSAKVNMRGDLNGVIFKESDLSFRLAHDKTAILPNESVDIESLDSLTFLFTESVPEDLLSLDKFNFSVTGKTTLIWRTDEVALKADLAGRHKKDIPSVLKNYSTVISASTAIRPFWKSSLPSDNEKISVKRLPIK